MIRNGESYRQFCVRLDTTYRRLKEHSIELPSEVRGWFLLKKLAFDPYKEAMVLTASQGSLKVDEVSQAVASVFPQGKCTTTVKPKEIFMAEEFYDDSSPSDEMDEVFEAIG